MNSPQPLIEASDLALRFGGIAALAGVSISASAGELVLLLGPNGAGKTTLLRSLAGLVNPTIGKVRFAGGRSVADPKARSSLGFLSHQAMLYDDLTPRENLNFAAALHRLNGAERRIEEALAAADLSQRADSPIRGFSRGMLQRLALARATLHNPILLLLDEPFTGLDTVASERLRHSVQHHLEGGGAVIAVTHEPADLWELTTRVVVMVRGKVVLDHARPDELPRFRAEIRQLAEA